MNAAPSRPGDLAAIIRGHQAIEDRLHWIRDMASLRNLAITILRLAAMPASPTAGVRCRPGPGNHVTSRAQGGFRPGDLASLLLQLLPRVSGG